MGLKNNIFIRSKNRRYLSSIFLRLYTLLKFRSFSRFKMIFLRKIKGKTRRDKIRNEKLRSELCVLTSKTRLQRSQMILLGHVSRMKEDRIVKKVYEAGRKRKLKPRKTWNENARSVFENRGVGSAGSDKG